MKLLAGLAGLTAALAAIASGGQAAVVIYTISGQGSGSLGGVNFTDALFDIELVGDTDNIVDFGLGSPYLGPLQSATVQITGFADAGVLEATRLGINRSVNIVFFSLYDGIFGGSDLFDFHVTDAEETAFDFTAPYGPVAGFDIFVGQFQDVGTSQGALTFQAASNVTFSAAPGATAVPEPTSWALMILGFGGLGGLLRLNARRTRAAPVPTPA
jgi:hypothetical protein